MWWRYIRSDASTDVPSVIYTFMFVRGNCTATFHVTEKNPITNPYYFMTIFLALLALNYTHTAHTNAGRCRIVRFDDSYQAEKYSDSIRASHANIWHITYINWRRHNIYILQLHAISKSWTSQQKENLQPARASKIKLAPCLLCTFETKKTHRTTLNSNNHLYIIHIPHTQVLGNGTLNHEPRSHLKSRIAQTHDLTWDRSVTHSNAFKNFPHSIALIHTRTPHLCGVDGALLFNIWLAIYGEDKNPGARRGALCIFGFLARLERRLILLRLYVRPTLTRVV